MATAAAKVDAENGCQATPALGGNLGQNTRAFKVASQKNCLYRNDYTRQAHILDREKKTLQLQLEREENEVRQQLQRLQGEQKMLQTLGRFGELTEDYVDAPGVFGITRTESIPVLVPQPTEVTNPYPITIPVRRISTPSRPLHIKVSEHVPRRVSIELEDLEFQASTGQFLPPLQSRSNHRSSLISSNVNPSSSWSHSLLKPPSSPRDTEKSFWAGDPEAIASVRRPRKTAAELRRDQVMSRSQSFKDGTNHAGKPSQSSSSNIVRSHSMRESGPPKAATSSRVWSRSHSLKERPQRESQGGIGSSKGLSQEMINLDITPRKGKPRWLRNRQRPRRHTTTCSLGSSPESGSAVWRSASVASDLAVDDGIDHQEQRPQSSLSCAAPAAPPGEAPGVKMVAKDLPLPAIQTGGPSEPRKCWEVKAIVVTHADDDDDENGEADTAAKATFY